MGLGRRNRKSSDDIGVDISPLIDMVFILLIFFMVTTTFVKDMKLELDRPSAASASRASSKALRVYIDQSGTVWVDEAPVRPWMLQSRVRDSIRSGGSKAVLVVVDKGVPAEKLVDVVDQCRLGGASDVAVATELEAG